MLKKIIGLTLALVMVLSMVQLPASAADATPLFSATIEGRTQTAATYTYSGVPNTEYFNVDSAGKGYINRTTGVTKVSEIVRSGDATALELVSNSAVSDNVKIYGELAGGKCSVVSGDVIHFSIDFRTRDMHCDKNLYLRFASGTDTSILNFTTDGKIKLFNKLVGTYSVDTWYEIDLYYKISNKYWYLCINNDLIRRMTNSAINATELHLGGSKWTAPADKITTVDIDDIILDVLTESELASKLPALFSCFDNYNVGTESKNFVNDITAKNEVKSDLNSNTTIQVYQRDTDNNAIKVVYSDGVKNEMLYGEVNQTVNSGDVFHFGVDLKFEDMINEKSVILRAGTTASNEHWNFIKFKTDGTIRVWDKVVALWNTNTWYEIDVYNDTANNLWYVYINDEFCACVTKNLTYVNNTVGVVKINWAVTNTPAGASTHVDNFTYGVVSPAYLNDLLPQVPADNTLSAVRNTVDANSILINASGAQMTGTLIAALYNGEELAEVKTVDAAYASYVTFTKAGDNAKIMWWNGTEGDITPKTVAVPVSFAAAN